MLQNMHMDEQQQQLMRFELKCVNVCGKSWLDGSRFKNTNLGSGDAPSLF